MAEEQKQGYVYILTNPSFREDWVKIGMSSRPVDVRSKELDNTAVPLPFEIYATLKTAKYKLVEQKIHKQIDRLTDLRIRKGREFFNVRPEMALEILRDEATLLDDAVLEVFVQQEEETAPDATPSKKVDENSPNYLFWVDFINYNKPSGPYANSKPNSDNWHGKGLRGIPGATCNVVILRDSCRVEVYFNSGDKEKNKLVFDTLYKYKEEIEAELGDLEWQRLDDKVTCRICLTRSYSFLQKEDRPKIFDFFIEYTDKFVYTFRKFANKF